MPKPEAAPKAASSDRRFERPRDREPRASRRRCVGTLLVCLGLAFAVYGGNVDDYFVGDDFDLIVSFHDAPPRYFLELLYSNESGSVWRDLGIDSELGQGYLRPLKIWLLKLDLLLWGARPVGFHGTATLLFGLLLCVAHRIIAFVLPGFPELAWLGVVLLAVHPVFSEIVPFITAREETLSALFVLATFLALLRYRRGGASPAWFALCFALGLLSKESAIVALPLALGWDLVHGDLRLWRPAPRRAALRLYGPVAALLAVYFGLRWIAFGNLAGGGNTATSYLSPSAFVAFSVVLLRSLVSKPMFAGASIPQIGWILAGVAILAVGVAAGRGIRAERRRLLLFFGPVWYLGAASIVYGTYFSHRHHVLILFGLVLAGIVLLAELLRDVAPGRRRAIAAIGGLVAALAFVPPTRAMASRFDAASRVVSAMRARIEAAAVEVPDGGAIRIEGVPQWTGPPYYFGWGLVSALKRPFTPSDLGNRLIVVNERNLELTQSKVGIPLRYDLELDLREKP